MQKNISNAVGMLYIIFIILFLCSCKKFLDKKSSNTITTPTTLQDLQALLDDAVVMNNACTPSMGEACSDNYYLRPGRLEIQQTWLQQLYKWEPFEYIYPNDWSRNYSPIFNSNYCIEVIKKIPKDVTNESDWNNVYGSALFYRAYYFLMLSWNHTKAYDEATADNDLGIVIRLESDFNVPSKRASVKSCYNQIISDAKESANYLPDFPYHVYRPSKWAAYGLLARTYLSMREYDSAYRYADLCLKLKSDLMDFNGDSDVLGLDRSTPFRRFNKETIFYTEMNSGGGRPLITPTYIAIDSNFLSQFSNEDLRRQGYFTVNSGYTTYKGSYAQSSTYFSGIATDEILLIRAEASARLNNDITGIEDALEDINMLKFNRFKKDSITPIETSDQDSTINHILQERRKELIFRGLRWMDIKRLNKEGRNIVLRKVVDGVEYQLQPNSNYYALPIPNDIINITGIEQN